MLLDADHRQTERGRTRVLAEMAAVLPVREMLFPSASRREAVS